MAKVRELKEKVNSNENSLISLNDNVNVIIPEVSAIQKNVQTLNEEVNSLNVDIHQVHTDFELVKMTLNQTIDYVFVSQRSDLFKSSLMLIFSGIK